MNQKNRHVDSGTLPVSQVQVRNIVYMATNAISDMLRQKEEANKKSKKGGAKRSVAILHGSTQLGCVSQDYYPRICST